MQGCKGLLDVCWTRHTPASPLREASEASKGQQQRAVGRTSLGNQRYRRCRYIAPNRDKAAASVQHTTYVSQSGLGSLCCASWADMAASWGMLLRPDTPIGAARPVLAADSPTAAVPAGAASADATPLAGTGECALAAVAPSAMAAREPELAVRMGWQS